LKQILAKIDLIFRPKITENSFIEDLSKMTEIPMPEIIQTLTGANLDTLGEPEMQ
jgi:hypothetical protein